MGRAVPVILLLLLVAGTAVWGAHAVEYLAEADSRCWDCHVDDPGPPRPLRSFWDILPTDPGPIGADPVRFEVSVQDGWYHEVRYLEPTLDLRDAPSLAFHDDRPPVTATLQGALERQTPDTADAPLARGTLVFQVPEGTTSLRLAVAAGDPTFDPEVAWTLHAGTRTPRAEPGLGPVYGTSAVFELGAQDFAGLGFGNWTLQAEAPATTQDGLPNLFGTGIPFQGTLDAAFGAAQARTSLLGRTVRLDVDETALFTWDLVSTRTPGPDEVLRITVNGTAHFEHNPRSGAIDWANITKTLEVPVGGQGGAVLLAPAAIPVPEAPSGPSLVSVLEVVGYAAAFLIVASITSGGVFGKANRRRLDRVFGSARRRVAFHNFLSYALTATALVHADLFLWTNLSGGAMHWSVGVIWGGLGILAMLGLGVTGALQVPFIRRFDYRTWRWTHFALAMLAIAATALHMGLDGAHFTAFQDRIGWQDPLAA